MVASCMFFSNLVDRNRFWIVIVSLFATTYRGYHSLDSDSERNDLTAVKKRATTLEE